MKRAPKRTVATTEIAGRAGAVVFWLTIAMLVLVPLTFSTAVHRIYSLPKFALLLTLSSGVVSLLALIAFDRARHQRLLPLQGSRHTLIVGLYFIIVSISTLFGVAPMASLFGSIYNQMGLMTQLCFFVIFLGLMVAIGDDLKRFERVLWAMGITGAVVATYACLQFFGFDPYLPQSFYCPMSSTEGAVVRVIGTLGHSNYLGNFLLYTTPICASLVMASKGESRWLMGGATIFSAAAILLSGTRGAWLGLMAGSLTFAALSLQNRLGTLLKAPRRRLILQAVFAFIMIGITIWAISSSPASGAIRARARALVSEGFTGAGRTLLWRDSINMVPSFALIGTGPEGFRKAFLAYKSKELARLAPQINNESSHNAYLDAAISYGLPGAIAYVAIIASTFMLLAAARRRARTGNLRNLFTGLLSSLVAVIVHNIFIYDQIATGLYFFALAALALVSTRVGGDEEKSKAEGAKKPSLLILARWPRRAIMATACLLIISAAAYSIALIRSDAAIAKAFVSANRGDFDRVVKEGRQATSAPDPVGDYEFLLARALTQCADRLQSSERAQAEGDQHKEERTRIINLGIAYGESSIAHTLTPDSSHLLVAYLALLGGDLNLLRAHATEALRWDPNYASAHRLMAEAYLAEGDRNQAVREANLALDINPSARDAHAVLRRAGEEFEKSRLTIDEMLERTRGLASAGRMDKARLVLQKAIRNSNGPCPECHRALASLCEAANLYEIAIAEWQIFIQQTADRTAAEQARRQVEILTQKLAVK